eukprot:TRINITY_DN6930_c0_g1_i2.p1 TRINITY_DN6930_c0_g1~~TRINITY_DN6930_c0_g1_i2.p1  ORF type:complete len:166 (+),score=38.86 TRINITY_DN6930_c0_g1_i2:389-886(+)
MLAGLWDALRPGVARQGGRISKDWGDIGFQGSDPATDFRGMGLLGLSNLHHFATKHKEAASQTLFNCVSSPAGYPFAITGINITAMLVDLTRKGLLNSHFRHYGPSMDEFNELYCHVFVMFNAAYTAARPQDVMSFGPIMQSFKEDFISQLRKQDHISRISHHKR